MGGSHEASRVVYMITCLEGSFLSTLSSCIIPAASSSALTTVVTGCDSVAIAQRVAGQWASQLGAH